MKFQYLGFELGWNVVTPVIIKIFVNLKERKLWNSEMVTELKEIFTTKIKLHLWTEKSIFIFWYFYDYKNIKFITKHLPFFSGLELVFTVIVAKQRMLFVHTTNMCSENAAKWNLCHIASDTHRNKLIGVVQHCNEKVEKNHIGDDCVCAQDRLSPELGEALDVRQIELVQVYYPKHCPEQCLHSLKQAFTKKATNFH